MNQEERKKELIRKKRAAARKRKKRIETFKKAVLFVLALAIVITAVKLVTMINRDNSQKKDISTQITYDENQGFSKKVFQTHPKWTEMILTENRYSRPGIKLKNVDNIYVHYVANPGTSAEQNRNYFEGLMTSQERMASAHFVIGLEGEIIQCVPLNEIAYAVKGENDKSVSIECCHPGEDGAFTEATYDSLIELLVWLTEVYELDTEDVLRHYDSNGKMCPLYYVEHEEAWQQLKEDVKEVKDNE